MFLEFFTKTKEREKERKGEREKERGGTDLEKKKLKFFLKDFFYF
jgi:hypothetical protein